MKITSFDIYAELLKEKSGLSITHDKSYLLESRLKGIAQEQGHPSVEAMATALQGVPNPQLVEQIIEAMTTNETFFFRDNTPFDLFKSTVMPYMEKERTAQRALKIWSAASSSGQEPYSLAMILKEAGGPWNSWNIDILGTDISKDILAQAAEGSYSQFEVQRGLPIQMLMAYFTQDDNRWVINEDIKKMVRYQFLNLLDNLAMVGTVDVIFCRNVLIYFDEATKTDIFERLARQLPADGFLFLGGAETVLGLTDLFKPVPNSRGLYAKADSIHVQPAAAA